MLIEPKWSNAAKADDRRYTTRMEVSFGSHCKENMGNSSHINLQFPPELKVLKDALLESVAKFELTFEPTKIKDIQPSAAFMQEFGLDSNNRDHLLTGKTLLAVMGMMHSECLANLNLEFLERNGFVHKGTRLDHLEHAVESIQKDMKKMQSTMNSNFTALFDLLNQKGVIVPVASLSTSAPSALDMPVSATSTPAASSESTLFAAAGSTMAVPVSLAVPTVATSTDTAEDDTARKRQRTSSSPSSSSSITAAGSAATDLATSVLPEPGEVSTAITVAGFQSPTGGTHQRPGVPSLSSSGGRTTTSKPATRQANK